MTRLYLFFVVQIDTVLPRPAGRGLINTVLSNFTTFYVYIFNFYWCRRSWSHVTETPKNFRKLSGSCHVTSAMKQLRAKMSCIRCIWKWQLCLFNMKSVSLESVKFLVLCVVWAQCSGHSARTMHACVCALMFHPLNRWKDFN